MQPSSLRIGYVLRRALGAMGAVLVPYAIMCVALLGPATYISIRWYESVSTEAEATQAAFFVGLMAGLLMVAIQGVIIHAVFHHLRGKPLPIGTSIVRGMRIAFKVMLTASTAGLLIVAGSLVLIVPGWIAACLLYVVIPVAVIERAGVGRAMSRSTSLTKGYRWHILALVLIASLLEWGADFGVQAIARLESYSIPLVLVSWFAAVGAIGLFTACCSTVTYVDLRRIKENLDLEDIAEVFE